MRRPLSNLAVALPFLAALIFAETAPKLDFDKVDPHKMLTDPYSYWSQPYNFYYFHHMDKIPNQRLDWVGKPAQTFRLQEPAAPFSLTYTANDKTYSLDDYLQLGDALEEGKIHSVDDPVTQYLPYLKDSAYKDATLKNLLQMASGIEFNEDYLDPKADIHRVIFDLIRGGERRSISMLRRSFGRRSAPRAMRIFMKARISWKSAPSAALMRRFAITRASA
jgi:hypothetical protein